MICITINHFHYPTDALNYIKHVGGLDFVTADVMFHGYVSVSINTYATG